jgi:legumain
MRSILLALALCLVIVGTNAAHYAVLVAGSKGYDNYRHQSDIFHAYQILTGYGIPADNIITFAYDDIAHNLENPFKGQVFNKPTDGEGKDVYAGVKIDYSKKDVTPENFLAVLKGDSAAVKGNRVLQSTAEDNVFIYFADHGATGLIAFPSTYLYANDLYQALTYMSDNKKYKEMVIYIEACESGSMFENLLPANTKIYATTAANGKESSWAAYCAPNNKVNGKNIRACLGDLYSINFLENLESVDPTKETLAQQFEIIKNLTTQSHVQQFGDLSIQPEIIGNFEANSNVNGPLTSKNPMADPLKYTSLVDSRYVKLHYLQDRHNDLQSLQSSQDLQAELASIQRFDSRFGGIANRFGLNLDMPIGHIDFDCLKTRVAMYEEVCGRFTDYGLKYVRYLHQTCVQGVDIYDFEETLMKTCV